MGSSNTRKIASLFLFLGIFIFPWWILVILFLASFIIIENFYEGLFLALIYDILYFTERDLFFNLPVFFVFAGIVLVISILIRKQLRI